MLKLQVFCPECGAAMVLNEKFKGGRVVCSNCSHEIAGSWFTKAVEAYYGAEQTLLSAVNRLGAECKLMYPDISEILSSKKK